MGIGYAHTGLRHVTMQLCLVLILLLIMSAGSAHTEEAEHIQVEQDQDQHDIYYDAMLRSIDLDMGRWKSFSRSVESGPWFYDAQGLKRNGSKVTVPVTVFPHPNRTELYSSVYPEHTKIRKIVFVTEINCSTRTYRQPQIHVYGYYGDLLAGHSSDGNKQGFSSIKTGTTTDTLRSLVCGADKKRH